MKRYTYRYDKPLPLEAGGVLENLEICYHANFERPEGRKVLWITHALTANSDPSEWWDTLVGPGLFFDTDRYFIICANMLGSCYGTKALWRLRPGEKKTEVPSDPLSAAFPIITIRDMVEAHEILRKHLGIEAVDLIVGGSSGGFQAVEWAIMHPSVIRNACFLATNARMSPCGTAWEESQRMALRADAGFVEYCRRVAAGAGEGIALGGNAALEKGEGWKMPGASGMAAARSIALISYRSFKGYGLTQEEKEEDALIARRAATYQQHQGDKLVSRFDPYSYYLIANTVDTHNVGRGRGGVAEAFKRVTARVLCIGIDSDGIFPPADNGAIAGWCTSAETERVTITSAFGHDGFLLEHEQISAAIAKWCPWMNAPAAGK